MPSDTPREDPPPRIRGKEASHGESADLMSWLSSFLFLSVPGAGLVAYLGHRAGWYPYSYMLVVYPVVFISVLAVIAVLMRFQTRIR